MIASFFKRFRTDRRAVAAVEFALIAPLMISLYFSLALLGCALTAENKASHAASAIGDLVSQATTIQASDMNDIFTVASTIMAPFDTSPAILQMRVSDVQADSTGKIFTVLGCKVPPNSTLTAYAPGTPWPNVVPPGEIPAGQSVIIAEVTYTYTPPVAFVADWAPSFFKYPEVFYLQPRQSATVTFL